MHMEDQTPTSEEELRELAEKFRPHVLDFWLAFKKAILVRSKEHELIQTQLAVEMATGEGKDLQVGRELIRVISPLLEQELHKHYKKAVETAREALRKVENPMATAIAIVNSTLHSASHGSKPGYIDLLQITTTVHETLLAVLTPIMNEYEAQRGCVLCGEEIIEGQHEDVILGIHFVSGNGEEREEEDEGDPIQEA